jgi:GxxExxY protein
MTQNLLFREESYALIGACFEVYTRVGCGFLESVYQECLEIELSLQGILFEAQKDLPIAYRDRPLTSRFRADLVCYGKIIVELKAVSALADEHRCQVINYLNATDCQLGLLINFGHHPKLEFERLVLTDRSQKPRLARFTEASTFEPVAWQPHSRPSA